MVIPQDVGVEELTAHPVNANQKVGCASRRGARVATRFETTSESEVRASVVEYLEGAFPSASGVGSAAQVSVTDAGGTALSGGDLTSIQPGSQLMVNVTLPYDTVRWIKGLGYLGGRSVRTSTAMRRE